MKPEYEEILPVLAHDLRNPIGAVITGIRFVLEEPELLEDPERLRAHLRTVLRSAESADRLLGDLLDLSGPDSSGLAVERREVRLPSLAREVLEIVSPRAEEAGVEVTAEVPDSLPVLRADRERLCQVLLNLLGNAIKFTPEGGRVELEARGRGEVVTLRISDTGPGIPPEEQERIFERYWQSGGNGGSSTGLGLAIVEEIVARHGGRVELESRPGEGSIFLVHLPVQPEEGEAELREVDG